MQAEVTLLLLTAMSIALLHTLTGPDHYVPFIVLSRSRGWSISKTIFWTVCCGCGHVWSSVLLASLGAALGWSISKISWIGSVRGGVAAWCMLAFGLVYFIRGVYLSSKNKVHKHFDIDGDNLYVFEHKHGTVAPIKKHKVTPWVMFIIFLLGPCEPMIPLLYFPAVKNSWSMLVLLVTVYTLTTLVSMIFMVMLGYYGIGIMKAGKLERHMHSIAGLTVLFCGAGMLWFGW
jgi:hypothetical protein